jgi:segregation and condensation protein B
MELKQVLGAIVFAAKQPMTAAQIRKVLSEVASTSEAFPVAAGFSKLKESQIRAALEELRAEWETRTDGFHLAESPAGFRFESDAECGPWVRHLLDIGKPQRLSRPALETLAIIAYRQPVTRAEIEGVRGVAVDHILRLLMELQLVKIAGRSELPGKPLLYGTTSAFLEHFGLKEIKDLPGIQELARRNQEAAAASATDTPVESGAAITGEDPGEAVASPAEPPAESPVESPGETPVEPGPDPDVEVPANEETQTP